MHLTGEVLHFYERLPREILNSYSKAASALADRFGRGFTPSALRAEFENLGQRTGERLVGYADRIRLLALDAFESLPEDYLEQKMVERFLAGLENREAALFCINSNYNSLREALNGVQLLPGETKVS
jgi:hypothetical protein